MSTLLTHDTPPGGAACERAAFSESLKVLPMAQNGYGALTGYGHSDHAAFALATPCEPCDCEDDD